MQDHCKKFGKQAVAYMLSMVAVVTAFAYHPPKANAIAASVVLTTIGTTALVPFLSGFCSSLGEDVEDLAWSYLFDGTEDEYVSDYASGAGRTTISSSDIGYTLPFYVSESTISSYQSYLDSGKFLSLDSGVNEFSYVLGSYDFSSYGSYYWTEPAIYFYTPEFYLAESDNFTFTFNPAVCCGRSIYISTWTYGVEIQKYYDGSWNTCWQMKPTYSSTSYPEYVEYAYSAKSAVYSLVGGYNYRVQVYFSDSSISTNTYAAYYGFHRSIGLSGCSFVSTSNTITSPASTRPSGLSTVINQYNTQNISTGGSYTNFYVGTVDANGDVVDIYDFDIFDESTMTITNPASGDTWTATAWEYDYETRSYYCTLEDDQYCRITYGDEYVTIIYPDEDGVYHEQYYYYVTAEYTATSGTTCDHVYTSETTTLPTCIESGWRTYTCALCGYSYETSVPATGHTWEETETVETEYNDNGDVTKLGYTIYTCADCGETYTAYMQDGQPTGPPDSSGSSSGSTSSGGTGIWDSIKNAVSNAIGDLVEAAIDLVTAVIKGTLSLATDMLSFFFDFLGDTVTSGVGSFFDSFSDDSVIGFFQRENEDGTTTTTLPEDMASGMSSIAGLFTSLPAELQAVLTYGLALLFLIAAFKIVL